METTVTRSIAGAGLAVSLGIGGWTASRLTLDIEAAVEVAMAKRISPEQAQRQALEHEASYATSEAFYETVLVDAVRDHGVEPPDRTRLLAPNPIVHPASVSAPKMIQPGTSWQEGGLEIRIRSESIAIQRRGITTKAEHTIAELENVGTTPIAYFVDLHANDGDCQIRALTRFNAMALRPGEKGEISICAGRHEVEVRELQIMQVTELGALWISKVPAAAAGYDTTIARSHYAGNGVEVCAEMPATDFGDMIRAGEIAWADLVDFYSRHDCEHYRFSRSYRYSTEPLTQLPIGPAE